MFTGFSFRPTTMDRGLVSEVMRDNSTLLENYNFRTFGAVVCRPSDSNICFNSPSFEIRYEHNSSLLFAKKTNHLEFELPLLGTDSQTNSARNSLGRKL